MKHPPHFNGSRLCLEEEHVLLSKEDKIQRIQEHFAGILGTLGLNLDNDSLQSTPKRLAKMYVEEIFSGLDAQNKPHLSLFDNTSRYTGMLIEKNITICSICEHHFLPIIGKAHAAYIPGKKIIGLSKINRLAAYCAARPQLQENLTVQLLHEICSALDVEDAAVWIEAVHLCVTMRGIKDSCSSTITAEYSGKFTQDRYRQEFLHSISQSSEKTYGQIPKGINFMQSE